MFFKKWKKEDCAEHDVWKKTKKTRNHTISWTTSFCFLDGARAYVGLQPIVLFFRKTVNTLVRKREIKKKHFKTPSWRPTFTCAKSSRFLGGSLVSLHFYKLPHEFLQIVAWFSTNCTFLQFFCRSQNPSTNVTFFFYKCDFPKTPLYKFHRFLLQFFLQFSRGGKLPLSLW